MSRSISLVFFLLLLSAPMARAGARPEPGAVPGLCPVKWCMKVFELSAS